MKLNEYLQIGNFCDSQYAIAAESIGLSRWHMLISSVEVVFLIFQICTVVLRMCHLCECSSCTYWTLNVAYVLKLLRQLLVMEPLPPPLPPTHTHTHTHTHKHTHTILSLMFKLAIVAYITSLLLLVLCAARYREVTFVLLGLDNAGKTTLLANLNKGTHSSPQKRGCNEK